MTGLWGHHRPWHRLVRLFHTGALQPTQILAVLGNSYTCLRLLLSFELCNTSPFEGNCNPLPQRVKMSLKGSRKEFNLAHLKLNPGFPPTQSHPPGQNLKTHYKSCLPHNAFPIHEPKWGSSQVASALLVLLLNACTHVKLDYSRSFICACLGFLFKTSRSTYPASSSSLPGSLQYSPPLG